MGDRDDDDSFVGDFENGHWIWSDGQQGLVFVLDHTPEPEQAFVALPTAAVIGTVEFKELDVIEQMRYKKRYQRKLKHGESDIITLQDIKDLVIYTAPLSIMSPMVIRMLHIPTTDRFLRALIMYCQYYLQVLEELANRMVQMATKIRTPTTEEIEEVFKNDLCDLRCLVAKEYASVLVGGNDTKKFHHMGPEKTEKSLGNKDARFIESFIRLSIQIVWLALGRRSFNHLELEVNRLFKTNMFNSVEHRLNTKYITKMTPEERNVLLGSCLLHQAKNNLRSPLINELVCHKRNVDYRMLGLGVINYNDLPQRLSYMLSALTCPEEDLVKTDVVLGILGRERSNFDIVLKLLPTAVVNSNTIREGSSIHRRKSRDTAFSNTSSGASMKKGDSTLKHYGYDDMVLPEKLPGEPPFPSSFPSENYPARPCDKRQMVLWLDRLRKLMANLGRKSRYSVYEGQD